MPNKSSSPRLPPELVLHVFEHSPKSTVIACSIVCRQWRDMSIPYMFHDLVVHFQPRYRPAAYERMHGGERQASSRRTGELPSLSHLHQFLQQYSRIAEKIHHLTIAAVHPTLRYIMPSLHDADSDSLVGILRILPQLRALTLEDVLLPERQYEIPTDVKLDRLIVCLPRHYRGSMVELDQIMRTLKLFGSIDNLFLERIWFGNSMASSFPKQLNVTSLNLRKMWGFTSLLTSIERKQRMYSSNTTLRRVDLQLTDVSSNEIREINSFLALIGPQLLHIGCSMPDRLYLANCPILDLSPCTLLRSVTLYIKMSPKFEVHSESNERIWAYLLTVLENPPPENSPLILDQLTLSLRFSKTTCQLGARQYLDIVIPQIADVEDTLLEWVERRVLRGVRVEVARPLADEPTSVDIDWMFAYFPRLHNAGVLVLSSGSC